MKPTLSKDGEMRIDLKVAFRIGFKEIVSAFCYEFAKNNFDCATNDNMAMAIETRLKPFRSRKSILGLVVRSLRSNGDQNWYWVEQYSNDFSLELNEQVEILVKKKFPEINAIKSV